MISIIRPRLSLLACLLAMSPCVSKPAIGADHALPEVEEDYSKELPRLEPLEPEQALRSFQIVDGFQIELVAAEPLITDPVAMAFDEDGRLYVVEMRGYSEQGDQDLGRIRLLEDTNQDGRFDKSQVYAENLSWPTSVACYAGGVFVGAAPDVYYFRDDNGDGQADRKETVYTGFGRGNVQGLLNSFKWGLDNRIHGTSSSSGGEVFRPDNPQSTKLSLQGRDFAIDPRTNHLRATSGGAQHGLTFNRWGDRFVCHNSDHFQMIVAEDRYLARNPYQAIRSARRSIAADGPQAEVFRSSPVEPWRVVRTRLRKHGIVPGVVEGGGRASGYFTSATGITVYEGNAWPEANRGEVFVADVGSNLVHRKRLRPDGAIYAAERIDDGHEFLASTDTWFRPVQMCNGPDGALYIADMYREVIEHPKSLPESIKRHLDLTSGSKRGRIYRVVPEGFQQPTIPQLSRASPEKLVQSLDHRNAWHRRTASRLLYERQEVSAIPFLRRLVANGSLPEGRIAALYALEGLGQLESDELLIALNSTHPEVQRHAVCLSETIADDSPQLRKTILDLVDTNSPRLLQQIAFSLGELSGQERVFALAHIGANGVEYPLVLEAVATSLNNGAGHVLAELIGKDGFRETSSGRDFLIALLKQIAKQRNEEDLRVISQIVAQAIDKDSPTLFFLFSQLGITPDSILFVEPINSAHKFDPERINTLLNSAAALSLDRTQSIPNRIDAIRLLRWLAWDELRPVADELLRPSEPTSIQSTILESVTHCQDGESADFCIERWQSLSPALRSQVVAASFSRTERAARFLDAIENGRLAAQDLGPSDFSLLASHPDELIRGRAEALRSNSQRYRRDVLLMDYLPALKIKGDTTLGAETFKKSCSSCHRHKGIGYELGPNLAMAQDKDAETLMLNILAPNAEVNPRYLSYVVVTNDGLAHAGMITSETATTVTLQRNSLETISILRSEIEAMRTTGLSLMPEDLGREIDVQAMANLISFLRSKD